MYLKDSESVYNNPKQKDNHRQSQALFAQFHSLQVAKYISICKQDVSAKQRSSSLDWNTFSPPLKKKKIRCYKDDMVKMHKKALMNAFIATLIALFAPLIHCQM